MVDKIREYLAAKIISDGQPVTYRALSRACKLHVNTAKQHLYEFHSQQTAKKSGSVHATYILGGTRLSSTPAEVNGERREDGEDEPMQSSPFVSSAMANPDDQDEAVFVQSITLVGEENLERAKASYEEVTSIHIYSLEALFIKDLDTLSDVSREIAATYVGEDPLQVSLQYGTIQNPAVKRRTVRQPPAPAPVNTPVVPIKSASQAKKLASDEHTKPDAKQEVLAANKAGANEAVNPGGSSKDVKTAGKAPAFKRDGSSIFDAFAKAKPKAKPADAGSTATPTEDAPMFDASDDDDEEDAMPTSTTKKSSQDSKPTRETKAQREARLREMMDADEPMEEASEAGSDAWEATPEPEPVPAEPEPVQPPAPVEVSGGRRRGRRRVTKKKTVKDEEGYLVTREEQTWESFSEDDVPAPPKSSAQPPSTSSSTASNKAKKEVAGSGASKGSQGSLMGWLGKKK